MLVHWLVVAANLYRKVSKQKPEHQWFIYLHKQRATITLEGTDQQWADDLQDEVKTMAEAAARANDVLFCWKDGHFSDFLKQLALWLRDEEEEERDEISACIGGLIAYGVKTRGRLEKLCQIRTVDTLKKNWAQFGVPPPICDLLFHKYGNAVPPRPLQRDQNQEIEEKLKQLTLAVESLKATRQRHRPTRDLSWHVQERSLGRHCRRKSRHFRI